MTHNDEPPFGAPSLFACSACVFCLWSLCFVVSRRSHGRSRSIAAVASERLCTSCCCCITVDSAAAALLLLLDASVVPSLDPPLETSGLTLLSGLRLPTARKPFDDCFFAPNSGEFVGFFVSLANSFERGGEEGATAFSFARRD